MTVTVDVEIVYAVEIETFPATEKLAAPVQTKLTSDVNAVHPVIPPVEAVIDPAALEVKVEVMVNVLAPRMSVPAPLKVIDAQAEATSTVIE